MKHVKTTSRAIEQQYPTMTLDEICAMPVEARCADDTVLYLWTTPPKLGEAFEVIRAWGFLVSHMRCVGEIRNWEWATGFVRDT